MAGRRIATGLAVALSMACHSAAADGGQSAAVPLDTLPGWATADLAPALAAFARSCAASANALCAAAAAAEPRAALLSGAVAKPVGGSGGAFVTGYFEPELEARLVRASGFDVPLLAPPPEAERHHDRAAIEDGALAGRGLEIAWLADPVDAFFLHVQGSGRLSLPGGRRLRVGYAGRNAHPYRSIGRLLVARGLFDAESLTADRLAAWLRADPEAGRALMRRNPSYIFFRRVLVHDPGLGPVGAAGLQLAPMVSVAVDADHVPPGSLLWLETTLPSGEGARRFAGAVVAQDAGAAIKGRGRVDLFFGSGPRAGLDAGRMRAAGTLWRLLPREGGAR